MSHLLNNIHKLSIDTLQQARAKFEREHKPEK